MSGGRVLRSIACARRALEAYLRLHVETMQAWVRALKSTTLTRRGTLRWILPEYYLGRGSDGRESGRARPLPWREKEELAYCRDGPTLGIYWNPD